MYVSPSDGSPDIVYNLCGRSNFPKTVLRRLTSKVVNFTNNNTRTVPIYVWYI